MTANIYPTNSRSAFVPVQRWYRFYQDGLTGSAWGDWSNYAESPLRAFESELGVQPPVGFWDPLGLARDGDVAQFQRRRSVELKHGRISMLATMGYITPEAELGANRSNEQHGHGQTHFIICFECLQGLVRCCFSMDGDETSLLQ